MNCSFPRSGGFPTTGLGRLESRPSVLSACRETRCGPRSVVLSAKQDQRKERQLRSVHSLALVATSPPLAGVRSYERQRMARARGYERQRVAPPYAEASPTPFSTWISGRTTARSTGTSTGFMFFHAKPQSTYGTVAASWPAVFFLSSSMTESVVRPDPRTVSTNLDRPVTRLVSSTAAIAPCNWVLIAVYMGSPRSWAADCSRSGLRRGGTLFPAGIAPTQKETFPVRQYVGPVRDTQSRKNSSCQYATNSGMSRLKTTL